MSSTTNPNSAAKPALPYNKNFFFACTQARIFNLGSPNEALVLDFMHVPDPQKPNEYKEPRMYFRSGTNSANGFDVGHQILCRAFPKFAMECAGLTPRQAREKIVVGILRNPAAFDLVGTIVEGVISQGREIPVNRRVAGGATRYSDQLNILRAINREFSPEDLLKLIEATDLTLNDPVDAATTKDPELYPEEAETEDVTKF